MKKKYTDDQLKELWAKEIDAPASAGGFDGVQAGIQRVRTEESDREQIKGAFFFLQPVMALPIALLIFAPLITVVAAIGVIAYLSFGAIENANDAKSVEKAGAPVVQILEERERADDILDEAVYENYLNDLMNSAPESVYLSFLDDGIGISDIVWGEDRAVVATALTETLAEYKEQKTK